MGGGGSRVQSLWLYASPARNRLVDSSNMVCLQIGFVTHSDSTVGIASASVAVDPGSIVGWVTPKTSKVGVVASSLGDSAFKEKVNGWLTHTSLMVLIR